MYKNLIVYGLVVLLAICSVAVQAAPHNLRPTGAAETRGG